MAWQSFGRGPLSAGYWPTHVGRHALLHIGRITIQRNKAMTERDPKDYPYDCMVPGDKQSERELFMSWLTHLLFQCESCLMRDVLRNQKENLWAEWLKVQPYGSPDEKA